MNKIKSFILLRSPTPQTTRYYNGTYEKEITGSTTTEYDYVYSPEGLAVIAVTTGGARSLYYVHTDHLGSLRLLTNGSKGIASRYRYDAWGNRTLVAGSNITNRGFTGHEHLPQFGLINMNARMYDPMIGRMLSPDPHVQEPDFSQSYNRYSYCLNNPLIYTDPDGELWWLIAAAVYTLFFTDFGYDLQKAISPVAIKLEVHPFGSDEKYYGAKTSIGVPHVSPVSYRWEWGANYYTKLYNTGWEGWETTKGQEYGLVFDIYQASYTNHTMHGMDDFDQTVLHLKWGVPGLNGNYYNDYIHEDKFKFWRKIAPDHIVTRGDDKQDRWRTAAAHFQVGPLSFGTKIITGDPGPYGFRTEYEVNGQKYYGPSEDGVYDPSKYSEGIVYVGIGPFRIGRNSEANRQYWQNKYAHKPLGIPYFPKVPGKSKRWYWFW